MSAMNKAGHIGRADRSVPGLLARQRRRAPTSGFGTESGTEPSGVTG